MINAEESKKIEAIMREAGEMLLSAHLKKQEIHEKKGPANYVTDYDVRIQELLIERLSGVFPEALFYGEEDTAGNTHGTEMDRGDGVSGPFRITNGTGKGYVFYIDPIDGTTNFMFDYCNSCVSVGLSENGVLIAGWVCDPYKDRLYSAVKGEGAFLNGERLKLLDLSIEEGICAFGCARYNDGDRDFFKIFEELFMRSLAIRNGGSSAIDLCRIASGSNVAYIEMKLEPYDYAAAAVILTEAGGVIGQIDGSAVTLDRGCPVLAGTPRAVEELRTLMSGL